MHQALYRKWRPGNFDEVSGQEHITSILKYQCSTGKFSHAYLFCGSRGTGKTSCAKILAKAVNCLHPTPAGPCGECAACASINAGSATDVLEMDAASNNGVDDIRDIRDEVIYAPSELKYRVYIIDEVHMLSVSAFNALLKTLEEPPEHVVFILATTELQKLPATIISRCQRFDFRRITTDALTARLHLIAREEGLTLDDDAARLIARHAQGGMRDAISLLELCAGAHLPITTDLVTDTIGSAGREGMLLVVRAIAGKNYDALFEVVDQTVRSSRDLGVFWQDLIGLYRDMLVFKTTKNATKYLDLTDAEAAAMQAAAGLFTKETLLWHTCILEDAFFAMGRAYDIKRTVAEVTLLRLCDPTLDTSTAAILARLSQLEETIITGNFATQVQAQPQAQPIPPELEMFADIPPMPEEMAPPPMFEDFMPAPPQPPVPPTPKPPPAPPVPPKPSVATATVAPATPKAETPATPKVETTATPDARRVLRPFRRWSEVVEKIAEKDKMIASFYKRTKTYTTEQGGYVIKFTDPFIHDMATQGGGLDALRVALSVIVGKAVSPSDISTEVEKDSAVKDGSLLDLILEAVEEE